jgi:hypothetical protein
MLDQTQVKHEITRAEAVIDGLKLANSELSPQSQRYQQNEERIYHTQKDLEWLRGELA